jgi:hypothetical protein
MGGGGDGGAWPNWWSRGTLITQAFSSFFVSYMGILKSSFFEQFQIV